MAMVQRRIVTILSVSKFQGTMQMVVSLLNRKWTIALFVHIDTNYSSYK